MFSGRWSPVPQTAWKLHSLYWECCAWALLEPASLCGWHPSLGTGLQAGLFWDIHMDVSWRKACLLVLCKIGCTCVWFGNASHGIHVACEFLALCYDSQWQLLPKAMQIFSISMVSAVWNQWQFSHCHQWRRGWFGHKYPITKPCYFTLKFSFSDS